MSPNRCVREGAIALDEVLKDIEVPSLDVPDLDASFTPSRIKDLFAEKSRAAWKDVQQAEARCDFAPNKVRISYRNPAFGIISLWKKSLYGRTLTDIKSDPRYGREVRRGYEYPYPADTRQLARHRRLVHRHIAEASPQDPELRIAHFRAARNTPGRELLRRSRRVSLEASCRGCLYPC